MYNIEFRRSGPLLLRTADCRKYACWSASVDEMHSFQFSTMYHSDQNRWIFLALYSLLFIQFMKNHLTALFKNTQILKFKSQLRCCQIILADLSGNRGLLQRVQKVMVQLWFVIGRFRSVLCVSRLDVYNRNYNWRPQKRNCEGSFWTVEFVCEKQSSTVYTAISRKVVGKSARDNPERYCGWFLVHCFSNKFQRTYVCKC